MDDGQPITSMEASKRSRNLSGGATAVPPRDTLIAFIVGRIVEYATPSEWLVVTLQGVHCGPTMCTWIESFNARNFSICQWTTAFHRAQKIYYWSCNPYIDSQHVTWPWRFINRLQPAHYQQLEIGIFKNPRWRNAAILKNFHNCLSYLDESLHDDGQH